MSKRKLNVQEKIELYRFLLKNGFSSVVDIKDNKNISLDKINVEDIINIVDTFKSLNNQSPDMNWITKLLALLKNPKIELFLSTFHDLLLTKCKNYSEENSYHQVYLFLAKLFKGEFSDLDMLNQKSINILLILIQDLQSKIDAIDYRQFENCLTSTKIQNSDVTEMEKDDKLGKASSSVSESTESKELVCKLGELYKFQKLTDFLNPLKISKEASQKLLEQLISETKFD